MRQVLFSLKIYFLKSTCLVYTIVQSNFMIRVNQGCKSIYCKLIIQLWKFKFNGNSDSNDRYI